MSVRPYKEIPLTALVSNGNDINPVRTEPSLCYLSAEVLDVIQTNKSCSWSQFRGLFPRHCIPVCQNYLI